jgi:hypothetical protein
MIMNFKMIFYLKNVVYCLKYLVIEDFVVIARSISEGTVLDLEVIVQRVRSNPLKCTVVS